MLGANRPPATASVTPPPLSTTAVGLLQQTAIRRILLTEINPAGPTAIDLTGSSVVHHDFAAAQGSLPDERFDAVVVTGVCERIPGGDVNWVLRELFQAAERTLVLRLTVSAETGVGSASWWRRRVDEIAAHYPGVSWELDAARLLPTGTFAVATTQVRRVRPPSEPLVWALTGEGELQDQEARGLASAMGGRYEEKRVAYGPLAPWRGRLFGVTAGVLDPAGSAKLDAPWPDFLITSGRRSLPVARWIRRQAGGTTKLVHLGRPGGSFAFYDLIVAAPDDRLPIRGNVLQVAAPLAGAPAAPVAVGPTADLDRPLTALFMPAGTYPWVMSEAAASEFGRAAGAELERHGGSIAVAVAPGASGKLVEALRGALPPGVPMLTDVDARAHLLTAADRFMVATGDADALAAAAVTGRPIAVFDLPRWHDNLPVIRPLVRLVLKAFGGDTYRGTPLQQHIGGRFLDWLTTRGLWFRPRDQEALYRSLEARGLATRPGVVSPVASPRPLDDLPRVVARIRQLSSEARQPG